MNKFIVLVFSVTLFLQSCEIINPPENIPSYIRIDTVAVNNLVGTHNITDVWVDIDGVVVGIYELPILFPIIATPGQEVEISAGIKNNGIAATIVSYPFYTVFKTNPDFQEGEIINLTPQFSYVSNVDILWSEDFEQIGQTIVATSKSDTVLLFNQSEAYYGSYCGAIFLEVNNSIYEGATTTLFDLPKDGKPVYLEMDYKNNNEFFVGVFANELYVVNQEPIIYLNKSENWNKIYIELTSTIQRFQNALNFSVFIGVTKNDDVQKAEVYIDNIKLIKFNEL